MPIDAIGTVLGNQSTTLNNQSNINENDFIKLFLSQIQFQNPLKPLDNAQFLTQLSQFVGVEQQTKTTQGIQELLSLNSDTESLNLLNHQVEVLGTTGTKTSLGTVSAIQFGSSGAHLTVTTASGSVLTGVRLSQIRLVRP